MGPVTQLRALGRKACIGAGSGDECRCITFEAARHLSLTVLDALEGIPI